MALTDIAGLGFLKGFDLAIFLAGIGKIIGGIVIFLLIGGIMGLVLWRLKRKKTLDKRIFWFEEINGNTIPIGDDDAMELTVPNTNITLFYVPKKNMYLPRGTKKMGKDHYWYVIRNNREIINFNLKNINKEMDEAGLNYDNTDMRYAKENLLELVKRNYKDGNKPWWREYKDVIATVIFIFVMSLAFFFLLSKIGKLITQLDTLISTTNELIKAQNILRTGSGVSL